DGSVGGKHQVAGGPDESIFQPEWSPEGVLTFVSDRTGWWNVYRHGESGIEPLAPMEAEFGLPQWSFGMSAYAFTAPGRLICSFTQDGTWHMAELDLRSKQLTPVDLPYTDFRAVHAAPGRAVFLAGSS